MNNQGVQRHQADGMQQLYSEEARINTQLEPDLARQDFKDEADTNLIIARFGLEGTLQRRVAFGEYDSDMDLQQAFKSIAEAKSAYQRLPDHLKLKYPNWTHIIMAVENGEITLDSIKPPSDNPAPAPTPTPQPPTP